ncbi:uncharacterized protein V2V93DRAFT_376910 [Kockiozyma suomiensis]|uniref:uncharacterized protein n=1 Tax=Kockiozyma suomiensis TaxID=1337062 RepID=UPI003343EED3
MPHRSDRQDAMDLLASWTNLNLRHVPGVNGSNIDESAKPDHTPTSLRASELGCWRAHANVWKQMRLRTASTGTSLTSDNATTSQTQTALISLQHTRISSFLRMTIFFVDFRMMAKMLNLSREQVESRRLISPSWKPTCTMAYAITKHGAQRLLLHSGYLGLSDSVDLDIINHV